MAPHLAPATGRTDDHADDPRAYHVGRPCIGNRWPHALRSRLVHARGLMNVGFMTQATAGFGSRPREHFLTLAAGRISWSAGEDVEHRCGDVGSACCTTDVRGPGTAFGGDSH